MVTLENLENAVDVTAFAPPALMREANALARAVGRKRATKVLFLTGVTPQVVWHQPNQGRWLPAFCTVLLGT